MTLFYTTWQSSMRAIIQQFGPPLKSVTLESYIPAPLSPSQIQVKMRYSTINPSDLITISGAYRSRISLPFIPGFEGVGIVHQCNNLDPSFSIGDRVLPIGSAGAWQQYRNIDEQWCFTVPSQLSDEQAATSYINPMTAWLMLSERLIIKKGMTLLINAANSAIGLMLIRMLNHLGVIPIAIVRRDNTQHQFEGCKLQRIININNKDARYSLTEIKDHLGIDAVLDCVGGIEALQLSELLTERGQFINYGLLSGQPIPVQFWLERPDIDFSYFHLRQWIHASEKAVIQHKLNEVMQLVYEGIAETKISARFSLKEIHSALTYVQINKGIKKGKVLLTF